MHEEKNGSDEISGGNHIGSDTFQNGSDIIRYPTVILSPGSEESDSIKTKDYDPDIYPEGTLQDIRDDEGDKCHSRSFVSMSDDEGTKERKENRSEYIRKRVARKRKHRGKIDDNLKLTKFSHKIMYF